MSGEYGVGRIGCAGWVMCVSWGGRVKLGMCVGWGGCVVRGFARNGYARDELRV
jgi:hypothetical protein